MAEEALFHNASNNRTRIPSPTGGGRWINPWEEIRGDWYKKLVKYGTLKPGHAPPKHARRVVPQRMATSGPLTGIDPRVEIRTNPRSPVTVVAKTAIAPEVAALRAGAIGTPQEDIVVPLSAAPAEEKLDTAVMDKVVEDLLDDDGDDILQDGDGPIKCDVCDWVAPNQRRLVVHKKKHKK